MISSATGPPTLAASAYELCTIYKSIACEAASGHTCTDYTRKTGHNRIYTVYYCILYLTINFVPYVLLCAHCARLCACLSSVVG